MNEITTDAAIMAALGRQMTRAVTRQMVAAGNLANVDTPGYHTRAAAFSDTLEEQIGTLPLAATDPGHAGGASAPAGSGTVEDVEGLPARRDGNTVQMDRELLSINLASADFSAAQTVLAAKFRLVRYAINEGR